ncbi:hypothetical protein ABVG11_22115 [Streptomyces sp. HD1123-B1]|uniref:hypothetical protein n=1 Tax=Streptomyces huangiella TaxID=3228804 RepID=UPI003D7DA40C
MERITPRRLRSSTVILGSMGALAAALTSCGSEPDKRCVDRDSYDVMKGYRVVDSSACQGSSTGAKRGKKHVDGDWYYDADVTGRWADYGTFDKSQAADRGGFGCSGSGGG